MAKKDSDKIIADQAKEISALKAKIAAKETAASKAVEDQVNWTEELIALQQKYADSLNVSKEALGKSKDLSKKISEWQQFMVDNAKDFNKEEQKYGKALIKNLKNQRDQAKILSKQLATNAKIAKIEQQMIPSRKKLLESQQKLNKLQEKYSEPIEQSLGFIKDIANTIEEIPIVGGFLNKALGLDTLQETVSKQLSEVFANTLNPEAAKQAEEAQNALDAYQGQIDSLNGVGSATEETANNMKAAAGNARGMLKSLGPVLGIALALGAAVKLIEFGLEVDQELTDMARGFGISREEAAELHHEILNVAAGTEVIGANAKELNSAFTQLTNEMGSVKLVTAEMAETQVLLTKQYGLAGDDASAFQKMAMLSGKTAEQNVVAIQNITKEMTGGMMNYKAVMKDVAGTSKTVQATFKGNIAQLTKAVITARKFGKTLDEVKSITDGLLDIEGSISAEMEARVLTGKDMNLDKARELALNGKIDESMEEIMKQAGGYEELMKMAPYQREAVAKAANMEVDALMKGAEQQKLFSELAEKTGREIKNAADIREEDLAKLDETSAASAKALLLQEQQASAQEKFAQALDNVKATFGAIASGPLGDIVGLFGTLLGNAAVMKGLLVAIGVAMLPFAASMATAAISAIAAMSALTLGIGAVAIAAGIVVGAMAMNAESKKAEQGATELQDGMIAPDGGLLVSGQKGTYQLHKDDTVVAGTGLGSSNTNTAATVSTSSSSNDMSELVTLMKQLIASVNQPAVIKIGNKVVTEMDRMQTMNRSYVGKVDNSYGAV